MVLCVCGTVTFGLFVAGVGQDSVSGSGAGRCSGNFHAEPMIEGFIPTTTNYSLPLAEFPFCSALIT